MNYPALYELTDNGLTIFQKIFEGQLDEELLYLDDPDYVREIPSTNELQIKDFATAKEMAQSILNAIGKHNVHQLMQNTGLWAWLTFVLRDVVFPKDASGVRKLGEVHRWYPSPPNNWQKSQRHMIRTPVLLLATLGELADHLLCGSPTVHGDVREQLTSQQDMFHPGFQGAARILYFDEAAGKLKRGSSGKKDGSPRNLARVRKQFDITWNLFDLTPEEFLELLPSEFNRFKPKKAAAA